MGFIRGVATGVALAAGAAAWYMSRAGTKFREQYRVDRKLGELGDQLEARTRDIQATVNAQMAEMRSKSENGSGSVEDRLDDAQAEAAEAAAEMAAEVEAKATKVRRKAETNAAS